MQKYVTDKAIGRLFGEKWLKAQNNPKLEGFDCDAEQYRTAIRYIKICRIAFLTLLIGILTMIAIDTVQELPKVNIGNLVYSLCIVVMLMILLSAARIIRPKKTGRRLAKEWAPIRRGLQRYGVLRQVQRQLRKEKGTTWISSDDVRQELVTAVNVCMERLYNKRRKAEREGDDKLAASRLRDMEKLRDLISEGTMKIPMNWDPSYFRIENLAPLNREPEVITLKG